MVNCFEIAKQLQALSQAGLHFCENPYDRERYHHIRDLSYLMLKELTGLPEEHIATLYGAEKGYPTPKTDIRAVVFRQGRILMVQEKIDQCWSLPGGWADVGLSPFEVAEKESFEESGLRVRATRLAALLTYSKQPHPPCPWEIYKAFVLCDDLGGDPQAGDETLDAAFFDRNSLPPLSQGRNTAHQIALMFEYYDNPDKPALCD